MAPTHACEQHALGAAAKGGAAAAEEGDGSVCPTGIPGCEEGARVGARRAAWAVRTPELFKGGADLQRRLGMHCSVSGDKGGDEGDGSPVHGDGDALGPNTGISP